MIRNYYVLLFFLALSISVIGQNKNVQLLGSKTYNNTSLHGDLNDVWGYVDSLGNEYALVGLEKGVSIVDVTDPANLVEVFYVAGPSTIWRDIKTWNKHAYICNELSGGLQIIDMSALPGAITSNDVYYHTGTLFPFPDAHNLWIDENGIAYVFGAGFGKKGAIFLDLNANPKVPQEVGIFDSLYLHDGFVRGDTLWGASVYTGQFIIVDVSTKSSPVILASHSTSAAFTHNCWMSDDGNTLFTTDEKSSAFIGSYDVSNINNIDELDLIRSNPGSGVIPHNTHVYGNFLVTSYYRDGVTIVDATLPERMVQVGNYDTSPLLSGNKFNGCWGAYPFLPSGNLLATDIENGLFVLGVNYVQGVYLQGNTKRFSDSNNLPLTWVHSILTGDSIQSNLNAYYKESFVDSGLYRLVYERAGYLRDTVDLFMVSGQKHVVDVYLRRDQFLKYTGRVINADNASPLDSADVLISGYHKNYLVKCDAQGYFTVDSIYEGEYNISIGKWGKRTLCEQVKIMHSDTALFELNDGIYDDFTFDNRWTSIQGGSNGLWERETFKNPDNANSALYPRADSDFDCSNTAYVTGKSGAFDHDVDGGINWLVSPEMDVSHFEHPMLEFSFWFAQKPLSSLDKMSFNLSSGLDTAHLFDVDQNNINLVNWADTALLIENKGLDYSKIRFLVGIGDFLQDDTIEAGLDYFRISPAFVGLNKVLVENDVFLYPNPFVQTIQYQLPDAFAINSYEVFDRLGRKVDEGVLKENSGQIQFPTAVSNGLLLIRFKERSGQYIDRTILKMDL